MIATASTTLLYLDLDGPLLDVRPRYEKVHADLMLELGAEPIPAVIYWTAKRRRVPEEEIVRDRLAKQDVSKYMALRLSRIESEENLRLDQVWPWVPSALEKLREIASLVLVTARSGRDATLTQLKQKNLDEYFAEVLVTPATGRDAGQAKAHAIQAWRTRQHFSPGGFIVGDTEADLDAGKLCGLVRIAVACGIREPSALGGADHLVDDLRAVYAILKGSNP